MPYCHTYILHLFIYFRLFKCSYIEVNDNEMEIERDNQIVCADLRTHTQHTLPLSIEYLSFIVYKQKHSIFCVFFFSIFIFIATGLCHVGRKSQRNKHLHKFSLQRRTGIVLVDCELWPDRKQTAKGETDNVPKNWQLNSHSRKRFSNVCPAQIPPARCQCDSPFFIFNFRFVTIRRFGTFFTVEIEEDPGRANKECISIHVSRTSRYLFADAGLCAFNEFPFYDVLVYLLGPMQFTGPTGECDALCASYGETKRERYPFSFSSLLYLRFSLQREKAFVSYAAETTDEHCDLYGCLLVDSIVFFSFCLFIYCTGFLPLSLCFHCNISVRKWLFVCSMFVSRYLMAMPALRMYQMCGVSAVASRLSWKRRQWDTTKEEKKIETANDLPSHMDFSASPMTVQRITVTERSRWDVCTIFASASHSSVLLCR